MNANSPFSSVRCLNLLRGAALLIAPILLLIVTSASVQAQGIDPGASARSEQNLLPQSSAIQPSRWITFSTGVTNTLIGVWAVDANNVWAVGVNGTILKWDGVNWGVQNSGTSQQLNAVWAFDANNAWAVGNASTILRWNGAGWIEQSGPVAAGPLQDAYNLHGIWGADASHVWAAGDRCIEGGCDGVILRWDGVAWAVQAVPTAIRWLRAVCGVDAANVWAVGADSLILKWNGVSWSTQTNAIVDAIFDFDDVWAADANHAWMIGVGRLLYWNGIDWSVFPSPPAWISTLSGAGANNLWASDGEEIYAWDGNAWMPEQLGAESGENSSFAVIDMGSAAGRVWAVGTEGTILAKDYVNYRRVSVVKAGNGSGTVKSEPGGVTCGAACSADFYENSVVTLTASASAGSQFVGWSGACSGGDLCTVVMESARQITATFVYSAASWVESRGWLWQNPLPQGNTLTKVWGTDANHVWFVGAGGTILKWDGAAWVAQASGTTQQLLGIWGLDANNIWAVGNAGTILRWNGAAWIAQASGVTEWLAGVWGASANDVWAAGGLNTIVHWDGTTWSPYTLVTADRYYFYDLWGAAANDIWAAGTHCHGSFDCDRVLFRWDGAAWTPYTPSVANEGARSPASPFNNSYWTGIWGTDANNIWVVGGMNAAFAGFILKWDGATWTQQWDGLYMGRDVWGANAADVWVVGREYLHGLNRMYHWDGGAWTHQDIATNVPVEGLWVAPVGSGGRAEGDAWAAGDAGTILKWDGVDWNNQLAGWLDTLRDVTGTDAQTVWAVGDGGRILRWNGAAWTAESSQTQETLTGVWRVDANNVWAVGANGVIRKWDGASWSVQASGTTANLAGVWGSDPSNVWAVGDGGAILYWNGASWQPQVSGTNEALNGVWGVARDNIWAVGGGGTIVHWDGATWVVQDSSSFKMLYAVYGLDATQVWSVGRDGTILFWAGAGWSAQPSGTEAALTGLWGKDGNHLWVVGEGGVLLRRIGGGWHVQPATVGPGPRAIWGSDKDNVWVVGDGGVILRSMPENDVHLPLVAR